MSVEGSEPAGPGKPSEPVSNPPSTNDIFTEEPAPASPRIMWPPPPPPNFEKPPPWLVMVNQGMESCIFKSAVAATGGGAMGLMFGLFFGGYSNAVDKAVEMEGSAALKLRVGMREAGRAMGSYAKSFATLGAVFSASECIVEKVRARHDIWNSVIGGCTTGAAISSQPRVSLPYRARATQMAVGCGGMAAFSAAVDYYMEYME